MKETNQETKQEDSNLNPYGTPGLQIYMFFQMKQINEYAWLLAEKAHRPVSQNIAGKLYYKRGLHDKFRKQWQENKELIEEMHSTGELEDNLYRKDNLGMRKLFH